MADDLLADPVKLGNALGVDPSDVQLLEALESASGRFRGDCRCHVSRVVDDVEILDGPGTALLLLPNAPVLSVSEVLVDGVAFTAYKLARRGAMLRRTDGCVWPEWAAVQVTYTHGYDPIPGDVVSAVLEQAKSVYTVKAGLQSITAGGESVTFGAAATVGVTAQWTSAVDRYHIERGRA